MLGALFPLGVFLAHIAKRDTALATCTVAVIRARLDAGRPGRWDIWLGVFAVLVVSFRQSGFFVLVPLARGAYLLIAAAGVAVMAGPRQPEHLWIADFAGFLLPAGFCLAGLAESVTRSG